MESEYTDTEMFPGLRRGSPPASPPLARPVTALALGDLSSGRELQRLVELSIGKIALEKRRRSGANLRRSLHICDVIFKARMQLIKRMSSSSSTSPTPSSASASASSSTFAPQQQQQTLDATSSGSATACETVTEEEEGDDEEEDRTRNAFSDRRAVPAPEEDDDYEDSCAQQPLCIYEPAAPPQTSTAPATSTVIEIQRISSHRSVAESNSAPVQCVPQTRTAPPPQPAAHSTRKRSSSSEVTDSTPSDADGKRARLDRNNNGGPSTTPSPPLSTPASPPTSPQTVAVASAPDSSSTSPFQWPGMPLLCPFPFQQPFDANSLSSTAAASAAGSLPAAVAESLAAACSSSPMCASSPYGPLVPLLAPLPSMPYWCLVWSPLNWLPAALSGAVTPIPVHSPTAAAATSGDESSTGHARADAVKSSNSSPSRLAEFEASSSSREPPLVVVIDD